jgi:putative hemolysin
MKEIPTPTIDLSPVSLPRGALHRPSQTPGAAVDAQRAYHVSWARHLGEVREAQALRYQVFALEMGARLNPAWQGLDVDRWDAYCEHLLVRDVVSGEVVGTYRLLTPTQAVRAGQSYCDSEFDLTRLRSYRDRMVELGRSCVHKDHRQGAVIMMLWSALADFMARNRLDMMMGCASIPMVHNGLVTGDVAASLWAQLQPRYMAAPEWRVQPRLALPVDEFQHDLAVEPPALVRGYLTLGARLLGAPAWDPDFNTADLPLLMRMGDLPARYRRRFGLG